MTKFIRRRVEVGIAKEGTRGTPVAPTYWMPKTSFTFDNKITQARSGESFGSIAQVLTAFVAERWAEGDLEGEIRDKSLGLLLLALFGDDSTCSSAAFNGAYKHTYTLLNTNQHKSLSIGYVDPIGQLMFALAMINTFTITVSPGEIVTFAANLLSKASSEWGGMSSSYVHENRFTSKDLQVYVAPTTAGLATLANKVVLKELTLTVEKNIERDAVLGSLDQEDNLNKQINITGTMTLNYEDRTMRDRMLDGNIHAMRIELINHEHTIGTTYPAFRIDLQKVIFDTWENDGGLDDIAQQSINFTAYYDMNNDRLWSDCYVVNEVSTY